MTQWRHDEWCATFLDGAPEESCDCVRKTLIGLEAEIERTSRALYDSHLENGILQSRCEDHELKIARQAEQITRLEASRKGLRIALWIAKNGDEPGADADQELIDDMAHGIGGG